MPVVFVVTIALIAATRYLKHQLGLSRLALSGALLGTAVVLWMVATRLHVSAIRRMTKDLADPASASHESRGVPRWVEELVNVALGVALAGLVPLVDELVPE
jgi:hypothetical protein